MNARISKATCVGVLVFVVAFVYAITILSMAPGRMPGIDSHYHFQTARTVWSGDVVPDMGRGLPLTIYRVLPVDHYWGFHLLLAPFSALGDKEIGMKMASATMFALLFLSLYLFLARRGIRWAWFWCAVPALLTTLDWRYLQLRGGQLMIPLMFLFLEAAFFALWSDKHRRWVIFMVAYIGMLSYQGAIVLVPIHLAGLMALVIMNRFEARRRCLEPLLLVAGLVCGLTLNPYMDSNWSTWQFAWYHIVQMGTDAANLYPKVAEFHSFPAEMLVRNPEWAVLLCGAVLASVSVLVSLVRGKATKDRVLLVVFGTLGVFLGAKALRTTEYAVPLAVAGVAGALSRYDFSHWGWAWLRRYAAPALVLPLLCWGLYEHGKRTWQVVVNPDTTTSSQMYSGAREVLRDAGGLVLNIAEADYNLLVWEESSVKCVHGLSKYFLLPNINAYRDFWSFYHANLPEVDMFSILDRFYGQGVRLLAVRTVTRERTGIAVNSAATPVYSFAEKFPQVFRKVFRSPTNDAVIYEIDRAGLDLAVGSVRRVASLSQ